eukprot:CAMPEP_0174297884 /NCGR_PEP_ID=MMETSP0809-20121228/52292_1 /TAXON_ID=73025 ORGANISM="Eutreptiella gymnastica-like, Strain CCMP1594" /NCGR_SAMPLE_ID=MMETSP0809 /ASSEMBLY_ACC=CAM_ASM_000658 /LENGTH=52 /DNA_ID=CAMNT_0015401985 /DNA_START=249 /DNA_END=407 /DNA_ORIENTATION=+
MALKVKKHGPLDTSGTTHSTLEHHLRSQGYVTSEPSSFKGDVQCDDTQLFAR